MDSAKKLMITKVRPFFFPEKWKTLTTTKHDQLMGFEVDKMVAATLLFEGTKEEVRCSSPVLCS